MNFLRAIFSKKIKAIYKDVQSNEVEVLNTPIDITQMSYPVIVKFSGEDIFDAIDLDLEIRRTMYFEKKIFIMNSNYYMPTRDNFVALTKQGYPVDFLNFPKVEIDKILKNDKALLISCYIRGACQYQGGDDHWGVRSSDSLYDVLNNLVDYFKKNVDEIFELEKGAMIEFISIVPIYDLEWFKSLINKTDTKYYHEIVKKLFKPMYNNSGYRGSRVNHTGFHNMRKEAINLFVPSIIVKAFFEMDVLWSQPIETHTIPILDPSKLPRIIYQQKTINTFYSNEILEEIAKNYPKEMYKIGSKIVLKDDIIMKILKADLALYGSLILDRIKPETGRMILQMSKSGYVFSSLPPDVLESNKDIVVSILKAFPKRIEQVEDKNVKNKIIEWLNTQ